MRSDAIISCTKRKYTLCSKLRPTGRLRLTFSVYLISYLEQSGPKNSRINGGFTPKSQVL